MKPTSMPWEVWGPPGWPRVDEGLAPPTRELVQRICDHQVEVMEAHAKPGWATGAFRELWVCAIGRGCFFEFHGRGDYWPHLPDPTGREAWAHFEGEPSPIHVAPENVLPWPLALEVLREYIATASPSPAVEWRSRSGEPLDTERYRPPLTAAELRVDELQRRFDEAPDDPGRWFVLADALCEAGMHAGPQMADVGRFLHVEDLDGAVAAARRLCDHRDWLPWLGERRWAANDHAAVTRVAFELGWALAEADQRCLEAAARRRGVSGWMALRPLAELGRGVPSFDAGTAAVGPSTHSYESRCVAVVLDDNRAVCGFLEDLEHPVAGRALREAKKPGWHDRRWSDVDREQALHWANDPGPEAVVLERTQRLTPVSALSRRALHPFVELCLKAVLSAERARSEDE